ncbi:MAG: hypothetical protein FWF78_09870 [Defluviitaleaceae bacterium]|nr:hypothetical protein [Defluviitaleaceae bacterium]
MWTIKNIIISGAGRAGKSTLARKLKEELNYFVINNDRLVATFGEAYPQLNIRIGNGEETRKNIAPFLGHFLGMFSAPDGQGLFPYTQGGLSGNNFVIEGWSFDFEQILPIVKMYGIDELRDRFVLVGLVQNHKTVDELVADMRKYDTVDDWTYGFDNDELKKVAEENISFSRYSVNYLPKYGFTIYDTSIEREQVFGQIINDIKATY